MMRLKGLLVMFMMFFTSFSAVSQETEVTLGSTSNMLNYAGVPIFTWFPDGHISILKEIDSEDYAMYWAGHKSYRTVGKYPYPEYQLTLSPNDKILGAKTDVDAWDNGGSWLMSVFRLDGEKLIGFYHAEDHYYGTNNPGNIAWKSLARVISNDNGITWEQPQQIITSNDQKPVIPEWGGAGDNSVIWDEINQRWLCYYQEQFIMVAMSEDPLGSPGTWYKFYDGSFSEPGLGGLSTKVNGLTISGGNPSVHFNHYLNKYVIVYHGWNGNIYLSTSADGIDWEYPSLIVAGSPPGRVWYPTIIGDTDLSAGKVARLYYAKFGSSNRDFISRAIIFDEAKTYKPNDWLFEKIGSFSMKGSMDSLSEDTYRILSFEGLIDKEPTYGYHYLELGGDHESSFQLSIDSDLPGPIGWAIRAGLKDSDEELVVTFDGTEMYLKDGTVLVSEMGTDTVNVQVKIINENLTISYKNKEGKWLNIYTAGWNSPSHVLGFFTIGTPSQPAIGYINGLSIVPYLPLGFDKSIPDKRLFYPNPASDLINFNGVESVKHAMLMNLDGQELKYANDYLGLSVKDLSEGIYVLKIIYANGHADYQNVIIKR